MIFEKLIAWIRSNSEENPGFTREVDDIPSIIETNINTNRDRMLTILTWGVAKISYTPASSEKNWFVGMITTRKLGVNLKKHDGTSREIQEGIMLDPKFPDILNTILAAVETNNYKVISISCTRGRHRSVAMAEILKKYIYPNAQINHLHL